MVVKISSTRIDAGGEQLRSVQLRNYSETGTTANSGTAYTFDLSLGNAFTITLTANCTLSFSSPPTSGKLGRCTIVLKQDATGGRTVSWPGSVAWAGGATPTLATTASHSDLFYLVTVNGGSTWYGKLVASNFS